MMHFPPPNVHFLLLSTEDRYNDMMGGWPAGLTKQPNDRTENGESDNWSKQAEVCFPTLMFALL
jgi:hypothetical protein